MYALLPIFSTILVCKEPPVETPAHLLRQELGTASTLRPLLNNANGDLMVEVVNDSGFAVAGEVVTFVVGDDSFEILTDSYGVARLSLDDAANFGTATWSGQSVPVQGVMRDSLPKIIGYETGYIPSEQESFASISATDGALYAYGNELWWMSEKRGAIAQQAGTLNGPILGLDSGHIDGDGF